MKSKYLNLWQVHVLVRVYEERIVLMKNGSKITIILSKIKGMGSG